eukprot:6659788-Prymnesium_polylepis.1
MARDLRRLDGPAPRRLQAGRGRGGEGDAELHVAGVDGMVAWARRDNGGDREARAGMCGRCSLNLGRAPRRACRFALGGALGTWLSFEFRRLGRRSRVRGRRGPAVGTWRSDLSFCGKSGLEIRGTPRLRTSDE